MTEAMRRQYAELKSKHPDALLLFRCGDFYESYEDDAEKAAKTLGIILTKAKDGTRLAGFPFHALDSYLPRLIRAGHRVAICDQLEAPKPTKKRSITELVKPQANAKKPRRKVKLPSLTFAQYDLLCECIRYRSADNMKERAEAERKGMFTSWYDDMQKQLDELKELFYNLKK